MPKGLAHLNVRAVYAEWWTSDNPYEEWESKRKKCAELLVPDRLDAKYIVGAYVSCDEASRDLVKSGFRPPITVDRHMFFLP